MKMQEKGVELRDYQVELFYEVEKLKSSILFLPTGSGKTHIAFWTIKSMVADLKKPIDDGGKRTFFLVNTVQLVEQQWALLSKLGNFDAVALTGDTGVDNFNGNHWLELQREYQVFIMTTQVYLHALSSSFLKLENANLLIFDECHHATGHHPMAEVMRLVKKCNIVKRPKVLGLSATLLNSNLKKGPKDFDNKLDELETLFEGKIISSKRCQEIRERYSAKPLERIEHCATYRVSPKTTETLENLRDSGLNVLEVIKVKDNVILETKKSSEVQLYTPGWGRSKLLQGALKDILVHTEHYGLYVGYWCCQSYIVQLYRYMFVSCEPHYIDIMLLTVNLAIMMRKVLWTSIREKSGEADFRATDTILKTSCGKLKFLFARLRQLKAEDRCLIFVQRKMTAKSLYKIVKIFKEKSPSLRISVDFIVGSDSNPLRNTREGFHDARKQKDVLRNFRNGTINVLITTDVLEEGIDIQECNLVIAFDRIQSFRSYIQSKGRARMKNAEYIILDNNRSQIEEFENIDHLLNGVVGKKEVLADDDANDSSNPRLVMETYETVTGATITNISAISRIYLYCQTLPKDLFTDLVPYWFYDKSTRSCRVKLPSNAAIRDFIQGPPRSNQKEARRAAAFEAVKRLHQKGHLDDRLLPIRIPILDMERWLPHWDALDHEEQENKSKNPESQPDTLFTAEMRIPKFLETCRPLPNTECYLHVIHVEVNHKKPKIQRQAICYELMRTTDYEYGILTRNPLPSICPFPAYTDLGEVKVTIEANASTVKLSELELNDVSNFHKTLFLDILAVVKKCFIYDVEDESNGYFVVPLMPSRKDSGKTYELSWKWIRKKLEVDVTKPSEEEIRRQDYSMENYVLNVVTPWYKSSHRYIVCHVSEEKHLESVFNNDRYETYHDYFFKRYGLKPLRPAQPLLQVRPITTNLDGICPRPISSAEKRRNNKKQDHETYLPPEYCHMYSFPSVFWYKSIILPSVLHRLHYLLMAEELRQKIVTDAGIGSLEIPKGNGDTIEYFRKMKSVECAETNTKSSPALQKVIKPFDKLTFTQKEKKVNHEMKIKDIDRELNLNLADVKQFAEYLESPLVTQSAVRNITQNEGSACLASLSEQRPAKVRISRVKAPKLMTLNKHELNYGPPTYKILEAITLKTAGDVFNLERLETLGDSLLKYLVSLSTFVKCSRMNEGQLTILKGHIVSNRNLFYCGRKLEIPSYMKTMCFSAQTYWCPPGFSIPRTLRNHFTVNPLSSLLAACIPYHEQFSGNINVETMEKILKGDVADHIKKLTEKNETLEKQANFYLGKHTMRRKDVSDVMEALIGVYLETCGIEGAFKLLNYFGVLTCENLEELYRTIPYPDPPRTSLTIYSLFPEYESIEKLCNYEFKNKYLLLQAFTHPSYTQNSLTDCYQKLEFIGDAVLDFLITSYIYEYCGKLNPGQLTDLRSALVNNNTFGAFAVRLQLHKHMLYLSRRLTDVVESFVTYQESKNFEIHGNELLVLINEDDTTVAEEVDVPKALGDLFESLAGAIFLDSGCNLSVVWNLYYSIMKDEIEKFSECIPINPVRALYEAAPGKVSFLLITSKTNEDIASEVKSKVRLKVVVNDEIREYIGRGENTKTAKRAAAKYALRDLNYREFVI